MITIKEINNRLLLYYTPPSDHHWELQQLQKSGGVTIGNTFHFGTGDLIKDNAGNDTTIFVLAHEKKDYYQIKARILNTKFDVLLSTKLKITPKIFIANKGISIFAQIDKLVNEPIVIGADEENAIPIDDFISLVKNFPTTTELKYYSASRVSRILETYFDTMTDAQKKLNDYLQKRKVVKFSRTRPNLYEYEVHKYEFIRDRIKEMLTNADSYQEDQWQEEILSFILLIFPKYVPPTQNLWVKI